jgi:RNA recognition motif-containing protein
MRRISLSHVLPICSEVLRVKDHNCFSQEENMGSKLYVGGLPYSVTGERLQEIFSAHGTVESANVIADKFSGQSRGFGFVEMSSSSEAKSAISALNGTQLDGRTLTVNEAKPQARRDGGGGGRRDGGRNRW